MERNFIYHCKSRAIRLLSVVLCLLAGMGIASAEVITVKGNVTSASDGEPLIGATVQVKGTTTGTSTDIDGNYSINAEKGATLTDRKSTRLNSSH